ncbi:reverse transcriptase domain-containing protein [Tanacetum coccineum]|uniref:Reverse transcriptase domain-containing protein n=1 Tax=Tanacetum coccineum TaxID=301880 RepID=A0ABQ5HQR8_9ASTR
MVVRSPSPYNRIIGRPGVRKIQAAPSTAHGMLKFPVLGGILTLRSSKIVILECTMVSGLEAQPSNVIQAAEERIKVDIHPEYPDQTIAIGSTLIEEGRKVLYDLLRCNLNIFAWKPADMTGVPRHIVEHRLNNVGATYQRLVDKAFQKQIGRNLEVYVDDLVIKSRTEHEIMRDVEETFKTLREINMKLNPKKYTFGIEEGMFLGYKVNTKGMKVCPDKVEAVLSLQSPKCLKDVQKLNGKLASLNRFISKLAEKSFPFFKILKKCTKKSDFQWTTEVKAAFKQMKQLIAELPTQTAPMEKRPRTSVKRQILADFIMESPEDDPLDIPMEVEELLAYGHSSRIDHSTQMAEYEALIAGLRIAKQIGIKNLQANVDSRLVANQVNGSYVAKESGMVQYLEKVRTLASNFKKFLIKQVPKSENKKADALSKIASTSFAHLTKQVLVEELNEKSINEIEVLAIVEEEGDTWMTPIYNYLAKEKLPVDKKKPRAIRHNSGRDNLFKDWCEKLCIRQCFASVKHPLANSLIERANKSLKEGIKARLDERSKDWIEEIPHVLWAHHTMIKSSNGDTPFLLTCGTEAVIPAEIGMPTLRTAEIDMVQNDEALEINLDLLEERRDQAAIREARSKAKMEKYYNSKVRNTSFKPGDLMYQNNDASHAKDSRKLSPKWEGSYEVTKALGKGAYKLGDCNGKILLRTWNVRNLKKCYVHEM